MDMEESITMRELTLLLVQVREKEQRDRKFAAALKGIDLDEADKKAEFEKVKMRADAALAGRTEEEHVFDIIGIDFVNEE
jgi:hypothetical protein